LPDSDRPFTPVDIMKTTLLAMVVAGLVMGCGAAGGKIDSAGPETARRGEAEMETMMSSRTLSVSIRCSPGKVYEFVTNPQNLPKWAQGLGQSVRKQNSDWIVDTPQGPMKVLFANQNRFGVMDHYVTTPSGLEVYVPMRVLANGSGSEVIFTLFRLPDMSDEKYAEDMQLVERDLRALKDILEK
jgi:hypothetical protein